jgi:hypothetical protein
MRAIEARTRGLIFTILHYLIGVLRCLAFTIIQSGDIKGARGRVRRHKLYRDADALLGGLWTIPAYRALNLPAAESLQCAYTP